MGCHVMQNYNSNEKEDFCLNIKHNKHLHIVKKIIY